MSLTGVIIAGGESSRFGKPKAFAKWKEKDLYLYPFHALENITNSISVITKEEHFDFYDKHIHLLEDDPLFKGMGPLAGLYTVMDQVEAEWYITLPVDTPCVNSEILQKIIPPAQLSKVQAYVPIVKNQKQPLIASYHFTAKQTISKLLLMERKSMHGLLDQIKVQYVTFDESYATYFQNINTQEELRKLKME
jgi:molybdenum cofactor guanylyltransferase